jgi:hypothetical protein
VTLDVRHTAESPDPVHHTGQDPFARPGAVGAALACTLVRHRGPGPRGYQYDVIFEGEVLVTSLDPEFAAARALRDRGHTGRLEFFRPGNPAAQLVMRDLVRAANFCATLDGRFAKYRPFDAKLKEALRGEAPTNADRNIPG